MHESKLLAACNPKSDYYSANQAQTFIFLATRFSTSCSMKKKDRRLLMETDNKFRNDLFMRLIETIDRIIFFSPEKTLPIKKIEKENALILTL